VIQPPKAISYQLLKLSGNPSAVNIVNGLGLALAFAGFDPANDLFARLGPEVAGIGNWRAGAALPDFAIVSEVRDQPGFARKLARFNSLLDKALTPLRKRDSAPKSNFLSV